jgi:hypothetical protein
MDFELSRRSDCREDSRLQAEGVLCLALWIAIGDGSTGF